MRSPSADRWRNGPRPQAVEPEESRKDAVAPEDYGAHTMIHVDGLVKVFPVPVPKQA